MTTTEASTEAEIVGLFADLLESIPVDEEVSEQLQLEAIGERLPAMPADLEEFDYEITNREARFEGFLAFMYVLRSRLTGERLRDTLTAERSACDPMDPRGTRDSRGRVILMRSEKEAAFNADFPYPEDFDGGEVSLDYQLAYRRTEIGMARAKRICMTACPLQRVCLASALTEWSNEGAYALALQHAQEIAKSMAGEAREYEYMDLSTETVRGGWGPGARDKIENAFHFWRRAYEQSALRLDYKPLPIGRIERRSVEEIGWPAYAYGPMRGSDLTIERLQELDHLALIIK